MTAARAVGLGILLALVTSAHAQVYKCVDERGVTHYSDKPRAGCKGGKVDIQPIAPVSGTVSPARPADLSQQDADFKRRQMEREHAEAADKAERDQRCARLRYEHGVLATGYRMAELNNQGERVYVDDASRDARLVKLKEELRGCP
jgi:hypothetical protein